MMYLILYLSALSLITGAATTDQTFTSSGEMNITSCPITYYGQKYETVYVAFSANRFALCFNGLYNPGAENDCIVMSGGTADRGGLAVMTRTIPAGSGVHKLLPNLKHPGKCVNVIPLQDSNRSAIQQVELGNFGTQAILGIKTYSGYTKVDVEADSQVKGQTVFKRRFQTSETKKGIIADMSGCRLSGAAYQTNTTVKDPKICSTVTCDVNGVATAVSGCGPMERCDGNGSCVLDVMCTVTGSTVVSFVGKVNSVPDRCAYTLMKASSIPGLKVLGLFRERRRRDVSFLDSVILQQDGKGVRISLQQGGMVQMNGKVLKLNATAQVFGGVLLSRDRTGVTATISASSHMVQVFFDGYTAIINVKGPSVAPFDGLCGSSALTKAKVSELSAAGCETKYNDTDDGTIDCNATTKWCNVLKQAPFNTCNKLVNPEPFVRACTNTLCSYPAVDGLKCQMMKAYARACSVYGNVTVKNWSSKTGCSAGPQAFCQGRFCSDHEFCGVGLSSWKPRCLCRADFASKYKSTGSFGESTVCQDKSGSLKLANCLLEGAGIDYTFLHLNDKTCKGELDNITHMVTFSFSKDRACGTVVTANKSQVVYKNSITRRNISTLAMINRQRPVNIDFSCHYIQPDIAGLAIKLKHSSVYQKIASGQWNYNLTMDAYTNPLFAKPIESNTEISLNERIWVELKTSGLDENLIRVVIDSCWATSDPSPTSSMRYDLIMNGCPNPVDPSVMTNGNGLGTSNSFSFNMFQFSGLTGDVYLHCKVVLCVGDGSACAPSCSHEERKRRSAVSHHTENHSAFISMAWSS